jgi:hypothetical protein
VEQVEQPARVCLPNFRFHRSGVWVGQQILFFVGNFNFQIHGLCYTVHSNRVFKKVMDLDNNLEIKPVPFEKWEELHDPVVYRLAV